jgi:hypothetical protein
MLSEMRLRDREKITIYPLQFLPLERAMSLSCARRVNLVEDRSYTLRKIAILLTYASLSNLERFIQRRGPSEGFRVMGM